MAMKTRVQRYQKYRNEILSMDDGDLPIARSLGKYRKEQTVSEKKKIHITNRRDKTMNQILKQTPEEEKKHVVTPKKEWNRSHVIVLGLLALIVLLVTIGIILAVFGG